MVDIHHSNVVYLFRTILIIFILFSTRNGFSYSENYNSEEREQEIQQLLNSGQFLQAIPLLEKQINHYKNNKDVKQHIHSLIELADALVAIGEYTIAETTLLNSLSLAESFNNALLYTQIYGALGNVYIAVGPPERAIQTIKKAIEYSKDTNIADLSAIQYINLGNAYASTGDLRIALHSYQQSLFLAESTDNRLLMNRSLANSARLHLRLKEFIEAENKIQQAMSSLDLLETSHEKVYLMIHLGQTSKLLDNNRSSERTYDLFRDAKVLANQLNDKLSSSYATGYLGELYEKEKRYDEALTLTHQALFEAEQLGDENARQLLFLWYWQKARLHESLGDIAAAIIAYQSAIQQIQNLRYQLLISYGHEGASFGTRLKPVYLNLVDLLLKQARQTNQSVKTDSLLKTARNTIEQYKAVELRDYFHDQCIDDFQSRIKDVGEVSTTAVVVYPIVLDDRLELLLHLPGGELKEYSFEIDQHKFNNIVSEFRHLLEKKSTNEYRDSGGKLYNWLVRPYKAELKKYKIDTLIFVPDGVLRTVPMSALYDSKTGNFLIQEYAIAITPSVDLTDPGKIDKNNIKALYGGISKSVQGFSSLDHVSDEIRSIHEMYGGKILLDEEFINTDIKKSLTDTKLNVLHFASHAQFGSTVEDSFILTFNDRLSINELADYVGLFKFRDTPLDLLVLSACETASGDARSALGLSGVAVKAGARSVLGALWKVDDAAASDLMQNFYKHLRLPNTSRAMALRMAQQDMINELSYQHPGYWSAYLLINNWL